MAVTIQSVVVAAHRGARRASVEAKPPPSYVHPPFGFGLPSISDEDPHCIARQVVRGRTVLRGVGKEGVRKEPVTVEACMDSVLVAIGESVDSPSIQLHINVKIFVLDLPGAIVLPVICWLFTGVMLNASVVNQRRFQIFKRV